MCSPRAEDRFTIGDFRSRAPEPEYKEIQATYHPKYVSNVQAAGRILTLVDSSFRGSPTLGPLPSFSLLNHETINSVIHGTRYGREAAVCLSKLGRTEPGERCDRCCIPWGRGLQCAWPRVQGGLGALQQAFLGYLPALAPLCSFTE